MIVAKINPPIKLAQQIDKFTYQEVTGSHMVAFAERYILGNDGANFTVVFGNMVEVPSAGLEGNPRTVFQRLHTETTQMSGEDIADWGTDDTVVLSKLAIKNSTNATEFITGSFSNGMAINFM